MFSRPLAFAAVTLVAASCGVGSSSHTGMTGSTPGTGGTEAGAPGGSIGSAGSVDTSGASGAGYGGATGSAGNGVAGSTGIGGAAGAGGTADCGLLTMSMKVTAPDGDYYTESALPTGVCTATSACGVVTIHVCSCGTFGAITDWSCACASGAWSCVALSVGATACLCAVDAGTD